MPVATYRKRPVEILALQWTGENKEELSEWTADPEPGIRFMPSGATFLWVQANETWLPLETGEWVIKDSLGFYPCKEEMFAKTYELVS